MSQLIFRKLLTSLSIPLCTQQKGKPTGTMCSSHLFPWRQGNPQEAYISSSKGRKLGGQSLIFQFSLVCSQSSLFPGDTWFLLMSWNWSQDAKGKKNTQATEYFSHFLLYFFLLIEKVWIDGSDTSRPLETTVSVGLQIKMHFKPRFSVFPFWKGNLYDFTRLHVSGAH